MANWAYHELQNQQKYRMGEEEEEEVLMNIPLPPDKESVLFLTVAGDGGYDML